MAVGQWTFSPGGSPSAVSTRNWQQKLCFTVWKRKVDKMKLYPDTVLQDAYDVIVIGAGLGGMTAASLLAKRGLSVLMIDQQMGKDLDLKHIFEKYRAVYLPEAGLLSSHGVYDTWLGADWMNSLDQQTGQLTNLPRVFIGEEFIMNGVSVVEAVAFGRNAVCSIDRFLSSQA